MHNFLFLYTSMGLFFSSLFVYISKYKHFLLMLLSLEFAVLGLYFLMMVLLSFFFTDFFMCMVFLSLTVCEGVLGLSLMVLVVRNHGSDKVLVFDNLW
uniref:NADH-ubiquinone oxidoreductase chain 4L n=1 Tax=Trigonopterus sp. 7 AH-2016 TaxID=1903841 RepID=A0A343C433_9CUCU|nr:NADH dehydrogenase subunit 4L [Trigonopterus sp. 7 AH-2016]